MLLKFLTLSMALSIFLVSCTKRSSQVKTISHTQKLLRPLTVSFLSQSSVTVKQAGGKTLSLKVYLKSDANKELLATFHDITEDVVSFELPDNIEDYTYIIAVLEHEDGVGQKVSAVDTYRVGEQDQINKAKEVLKNRN